MLARRVGEFEPWLDRGVLPAGVRRFPRAAIPRAPVVPRHAGETSPTAHAIADPPRSPVPSRTPPQAVEAVERSSSRFLPSHVFEDSAKPCLYLAGVHGGHILAAVPRCLQTLSDRFDPRDHDCLAISRVRFLGGGHGAQGAQIGVYSIQ
jgi:hypothetical protein